MYTQFHTKMPQVLSSFDRALQACGLELLLVILTKQVPTANEHANRYEAAAVVAWHYTNVQWGSGRVYELIFVV
jgi:hypothetical protein